MATRWRQVVAGVLVGLGGLVGLTLLADPAAAQVGCTITWDGQLGDDWMSLQPFGPGPEDDVTNWTPNRLPSSTDHACLPSGSTAVLRNNNSAIVLRYTISAGASLTVDGNLGGGGLEAREDSSNAGTLSVTGPRTLSFYDGDPNNSEGLTNTGTLRFPTGGAAGFRFLTGDLTNDGLIDVDYAEVSFQNPGIGGGPARVTQENRGTVDVSTGNVLRLLNSTFVHGPSSVIQGGGTVNTGNVRFEVSGNASITGGTDVNLGTSSVLAGTAGSTATGNVDFPPGTTARIEGTVPAGITVDVDAAPSFATEVRFETADVTNAGRINLNGGGASLNVIPNATPATNELINTGTIEFTNTGTGFRNIFGTWINRGSVLVRHPEANVDGVNTSTFTNEGTVDVSAGDTLRIIRGTVVHGQGSVIQGGGTVNTDLVRWEVSGNASIAAGTDVNLARDVLAGTAGAAAGNFDIAPNGNSRAEGTIPAGVTVDVDGPTSGETTLRFETADVTNAGRINLNGASANLHVVPNADPATNELINAGTLAFTNTGTGLRSIVGSVTNTGTLLVDHAEANMARFGASGTLLNEGTITVSPGRALRLCCGGTGPTLVNGVGGTIDGGGRIFGGARQMEVRANSTVAAGTDVELNEGADLIFTSATGATGRIGMNGADFQGFNLTGNVPAGVTVDLMNQIGVRALASLTNAGRINFGPGSFLAVEDGTDGTIETLTNTGQLVMNAGGGNTVLTGDLSNQGTITVSHPSTEFRRGFENRNPKLTNTATGTITINAGGVLYTRAGGWAQAYENAGTVNIAGRLSPGGYTQTGGTTTLSAASGNAIDFTTVGTLALQGGTLRGFGTINSADVVNSGGTVAPGLSPGRLTINANYTQSAGGTLAVEVQGDTAATGFDQLVVGGTASLAGELDVTTSSFTPTPGSTFRILDAPAPPTAPTVTGTFGTVDQHGATYAVGHNPTDVTLTAQAASFQPDGQIRNANQAAFGGNDVVNLNGAGQSRSQNRRIGQKATFYARVQNDGDAADGFRVRAPRGTNRFTVRYFLDSTNITTSVVNGTRVLAGVAPGANRVVRVEVTPRAGTPRNAAINLLIRFTSTNDATRRDVVKATVRRT